MKYSTHGRISPRQTALLVLLTAGMAFGAALPRVYLWRQVELPLTTATEHKNPFTDVTVTATFASPSGKKYVVDGFHNGGNSWRVRFMPTEVGVWGYATKSSDKAMPKLRGRFKCLKWETPGPVGVDGKNPRRWAYASGEPFILSAAKCLPLFGLPKHTPHLAFGGWDAFVDACADRGFNTIAVTPYFTRRSVEPSGGTRGSLPEYATVWPRRGDASEPGDINRAAGVDFDRFYLEQWQKMDEIIRYMHKKGIVAYIVLHPGGARSVHNTDGFRRPAAMDDDQEELYFRYAAARLGAFVNVQWCLGLDYKRYRDAGWARKAGKLFDELDPYDHPLSIHGDSGLRLAGQDWLDFICLSGDVNEGRTYDRAFKHKKPVVYYDYGNDDGEKRTGAAIRRANWAMALAGAYGVYGNVKEMSGDFREVSRPSPGAQSVSTLLKILRALPLNEMEPASGLVQRGSECLACPGEAYLVYLPRGGDTVLDLSKEKEAMNVTRIDPRSGERSSLEPSEPGDRLKLSAPSRRAWAFTVVKPQPVKPPEGEDTE